MTTAAPSTALATIQPAFTAPERLALAGYLVGYCGLTILDDAGLGDLCLISRHGLAESACPATR